MIRRSEIRVGRKEKHQVIGQSVNPHDMGQKYHPPTAVVDIR